jgi:hypothetical protein
VRAREDALTSSRTLACGRTGRPALVWRVVRARHGLPRCGAARVGLRRVRARRAQPRSTARPCPPERAGAQRGEEAGDRLPPQLQRPRHSSRGPPAACAPTPQPAAPARAPARCTLGPGPHARCSPLPARAGRVRQPAASVTAAWWSALLSRGGAGVAEHRGRGQMRHREPQGQPARGRVHPHRVHAARVQAEGAAAHRAPPRPAPALLSAVPCRVAQLVLKTCGTTPLLQCLPRLLKEVWPSAVCVWTRACPCG